MDMSYILSPCNSWATLNILLIREPGKKEIKVTWEKNSFQPLDLAGFKISRSFTSQVCNSIAIKTSNTLNPTSCYMQLPISGRCTIESFFKKSRYHLKIT